MLITFCKFVTKIVDMNDNIIIKFPGPKWKRCNQIFVSAASFTPRLMKTILYVYFYVNTYLPPPPLETEE
jgi:hypothetical protein